MLESVKTESLNWQNSPPFGRRKTLIATLELLAERFAGVPQVILEVGTAEAYSPEGLGNALLAFGWYAIQKGAIIHTVDIREGAIKNSGTILREYCPNAIGKVEFHRTDAFEYAAGVIRSGHWRYLDHIDLIYYDGPSEPQSWYVDLHNRWADKFKTTALALFDDTLPGEYNGKGAKLIPQLIADGWRDLKIDGEPVFPMVLLEKI